MYVTYFNGEWSNGNVPLYGAMDHSVWLGSSVFDGARSLRGHLPDIRLHLQRVVDSAQRLDLSCPLSVDQMEGLVREGVQMFPSQAELYIRPLVFASDGLFLPVKEASRFALTLFDAPFPPFSGFSACVSSLRRPHPDMAPTDAKASALYPLSARMLRDALIRGFDNAVVLDGLGNVVEFTNANLFLVTPDQEVVTPAPNGTFLTGITRARVIQLLAQEGIAVKERRVQVDDLKIAKEIFSTGNFGKVSPCTRFREQVLNIGPVTRLARESYLVFAENS